MATLFCLFIEQYLLLYTVITMVSGTQGLTRPKVKIWINVFERTGQY